MNPAHLPSLPSPSDTPSKQEANQIRSTKGEGEAFGGDDDDRGDDDDMTIVVLDARRFPFNSFLPGDEEGGGDDADDDVDRRIVLLHQQQQQARRNGMVQELRLVQRMSFRLFVAIGFVPVVLLVIALAAVLSNDVNCSALSPTASDVATILTSGSGENRTTDPVSDDAALVSCWNEPRTFRNAFTTRCICESVPAFS